MAGSEALVSNLKIAVDSRNISFLEAARSAGYNAQDDDNDFTTVLLKKGSYAGFVELHIEQGPILENEGKSFSFSDTLSHNPIIVI